MGGVVSVTRTTQVSFFFFFVKVVGESRGDGRREDKKDIKGEGD